MEERLGHQLVIIAELAFPNLQTALQDGLRFRVLAQVHVHEPQLVQGSSHVEMVLAELAFPDLRAAHVERLRVRVLPHPQVRLG